MNQDHLRTPDFYVQGAWLPGTWEPLKKDTIFRLVEPDGRVANQGTEYEVCIAVEDAVVEPVPVFWSVKCEHFTFITPAHPLASRIRVVDEAGLLVEQVSEMNVPMGIAKLGTCRVGHPLQWDGRMMSGVHVEVVPSEEQHGEEDRE